MCPHHVDEAVLLLQMRRLVQCSDVAGATTLPVPKTKRDIENAVLSACKEWPNAMREAPAELRADKHFVLAAIRNVAPPLCKAGTGCHYRLQPTSADLIDLLQHINPSLKADKETALAMVAHAMCALDGGTLWSDGVLSVVCPEWRNDADVKRLVRATENLGRRHALRALLLRAHTAQSSSSVCTSGCVLGALDSVLSTPSLRLFFWDRTWHFRCTPLQHQRVLAVLLAEVRIDNVAATMDAMAAAACGDNAQQTPAEDDRTKVQGKPDETVSTLPRMVAECRGTRGRPYMLNDVHAPPSDVHTVLYDPTMLMHACPPSNVHTTISDPTVLGHACLPPLPTDIWPVSNQLCLTS